jgi:hypothetical protein
MTTTSDPVDTAAPGAQDITSVPGHLFTAAGKWKYDVSLDYTGLDLNHWNTATLAEQALASATRNGTSGVKITALGDTWRLVVINPPGPYSYPIMAGMPAARA